MVAQVIKTLALLVILVIFGITIGAYASDGAATPILILAAIMGLFALNWLGTKSWLLIIILPPIMGYLPLGPLALFNPSYVVATGVLLYWTVLFAMGQVKFEWKPLIWMDLCIIAITVYFAASFYRNPVGIAMLSWETEYVGGKEYALCLIALFFYLAMSLIPMERKRLMTALKWAMILTAFTSVFGTASSVSNRGIESTLEAAETSRFSTFVGLGRTIVYLILSYHSPVAIAISWWRSGSILLGMGMILLSGFREELGRLLIAFCVASVVYKQLIIGVIVGGICYAGLLFISNEKMLYTLPHGIQRALYLLPGMEIEESIKSGAEHSSEWRYEMWEWAEDPRQGYIKDYTWGDGFGISVEYLRLQKIRQNRGQLNAGEQEFFAETGTWHSGRISIIHRLGYVGWYMYIVVTIICLLIVLRTYFIYRKTSIFPYFFFTTVTTFSNLFITFFSVGKPGSIFEAYYTFALAKILYVQARKNGEIKPMIGKRGDHYVPKIISEQGGA